jgi:hypothetical protein
MKPLSSTAKMVYGKGGKEGGREGRGGKLSEFLSSF